MKSLPKPTSKLTSTLLKYLTVALIIFIPLYPKFPLFFIPKAKVAVRAEDFIFFISGFILLIHYLKLKINLNKIPLFLQIMAYWTVGALSLFSAILITRTVLPQIGLLHLFRRIEYMIGFFMAYEVVKQEAKNSRFFLEATILGSFIVLLYGFAQIYLQAPVISTMNDEFSKGAALTLQPGVPISSTFAGQYDLAVYLVFILSILAAVYSKLKNRILISLLGVFFLGELWLLLQTGSRVPAVTALICVTLVLFLSKKIKTIPLFWAAFFIIAVNSSNLTGRLGSFFKILDIKRMVSQVQLAKPAYAASAPAVTVTPTPTEALRAVQQDRSTSIRIDVEWPRAMQAFYKNPLLGTGFSSITLATDNDYFRALGETGLLGLLCFFSLLLYLVRFSVKSIKNRSGAWWQSFNLAYLGILLGMLLIGTFLDVFEASKVASLFWIFTGINLAVKS